MNNTNIEKKFIKDNFVRKEKQILKPLQTRGEAIIVNAVKGEFNLT
ncbi:hypothetical protein [Clostridium carboxidivorans]|nr:hypothetical protein [Clostridium carboxidivorans]